jgi:hypothetical protein
MIAIRYPLAALQRELTWLRQRPPGSAQRGEGLPLLQPGTGLGLR